MENKEIILENVDEKFANLRNICPDMDEDMYVLADYIATFINQELVPEGLILQLAILLNDLEKGKSSRRDKPFSATIVNNKKKFIALLTHIPEVIDKIADEKFSKKFRELANDALGDEIPIIEKNEYNPISDYPENIQAAVNWWADQIQEPPKYNKDNLTPAIIMSILQGKTKLSEHELNNFKESLARSIKIDMDKYHYSTLRVDYTPCRELQIAGDAAGLNPAFDFPWKTTMNIEEEKIEVYSNGKGETIWIKDKNKDEHEYEIIIETFAEDKTEEKSEGKGKTKRKVK